MATITQPPSFTSMLDAEALVHDLLDFENDALLIVSDSSAILLAPKETRNRLQRGERSLVLRELSDCGLAAKYGAGTEKRQAFLVEAQSPDSRFDEWTPAMWSDLRESGIHGILVLYDNTC